MRIFYLARLFSGLESSFLDKHWSPTGVPTIYRVIERLDKKHNICLVFTAKDCGSGYFSSWNKSNDEKLSIDGLIHSVTIVSGINFFPTWISVRIRVILREVRQTALILYKIYKFKPDILYCDHANIIIAAIFSRIQKKIPVVFRVMGINQFMRTSISSSKIYHRIYSWAYRSPFSLVICTQDGSGVEKWTGQALLAGVQTEILLNGTDSLVFARSIDPKLDNLPSDKIIIMFVGKLEVYKGCYEFVIAILSLINSGITNVHALIIGSGTEEKKLVELVNNACASIFFTFIKLLPHSQILHAHTICDIYVSMNHLGNLSNANLEAIQPHDCMIIPESQKDKGIDEVTVSLLGESIVSVPINCPDQLFNALVTLIDSESKREEMSRNIKEIKKNFIWSWDDRINSELDILENLNGASR
jgi:glycosyltransferase involved in cell wall biosynthesis